MVGTVAIPAAASQWQSGDLRPQASLTQSGAARLGGENVIGQTWGEERGGRFPTGPCHGATGSISGKKLLHCPVSDLCLFCATYTQLPYLKAREAQRRPVKLERRPPAALTTS